MFYYVIIATYLLLERNFRLENRENYKEFIDILLERIEQKTMIIQQLQQAIVARDKNIELCEEEIEKLKSMLNTQ